VSNALHDLTDAFFYKFKFVSSYETVVKRWPIIITGVVSYLHNKCHTLSLDLNSLDGEEKAAVQKKLAEGTEIIEKVSKLKYEMARDRALG